jgi:hypothetical protein
LNRNQPNLNGGTCECGEKPRGKYAFTPVAGMNNGCNKKYG